MVSFSCFPPLRFKKQCFKKLLSKLQAIAPISSVCFRSRVNYREETSKRQRTSSHQSPRVITSLGRRSYSQSQHTSAPSVSTLLCLSLPLPGLDRHPRQHPGTRCTLMEVMTQERTDAEEDLDVGTDCPSRDASLQSSRARDGEDHSRLLEDSRAG